MHTAPTIRDTRPFINGEYVNCASGNTFESINPANGRLNALIQECGEAELNMAVDAARQALPVWNALKSEDKADMIRKISALIKEQSEYIGTLESIDLGMPLASAKAHFLPRSAALFGYAAGVVDKIHGRIVPIDPGYMSYNIHEPYGVVGIILPWNAPFAELSLAVSAAIACGNTVVVKPAFETHLSALALGRILQEAGLPAGVVNIVTGRGGIIGAAMSEHPGIDKIIFTGGQSVGRDLARKAAGTLKRYSLELGGKTPVIVLEDADLEKASSQIAFSFQRNSGQVCTAASRLFLHKCIAEPFKKMLIEKAKGFKLGDPLEVDTAIGPVVSAKHRDNILRYIEEGKRSGATVLLGGGTPEDPALAQGYYVCPTIFENVDHSSFLAQEEIFGPVLCIFEFEELDEALAMANDVVYGLGSSVWTRDIQKAHECIRSLDDGYVWVNCINLSNPAITGGGFKQSGVGFTNGIESAMYTYTRTKTVWINLQ